MEWNTMQGVTYPQQRKMYSWTEPRTEWFERSIMTKEIELKIDNWTEMHIKKNVEDCVLLKA